MYRNADLEMANNGSKFCILYTLYTFSFSVSDREMLRVWKDLSEKYRMDYTDDHSHEHIEVNVI